MTKNSARLAWENDNRSMTKEDNYQRLKAGFKYKSVGFKMTGGKPRPTKSKAVLTIIICVTSIPLFVPYMDL